jgi:hypothetical protein
MWTMSPVEVAIFALVIVAVALAPPAVVVAW